MSNALDLLSNSLRKYIVAPAASFGAGGFLFDIESDVIASLQSDITDHYTENNVAIQDHIAQRPRRIILRGYVGEVVYNVAGESNNVLQKPIQRLTTITSFLPALSSAAKQIQGAITSNSLANITLNDASNIYGLVKNALPGSGPQTKQRNAFAYFQALWRQKVLMGVQTPWEFFPNMAIESVRAIQPEETQYVSDFAVTFKEMRFATTQTLAFTAGNTLKQGAAALQGAAQTPIGQVPGLDLPSKLISGAQGLISGPSGFSNSSLRSIWGQ